MYLGIDVGGTYTDGVLIKDKQIFKKIKIPTEKNDLTSSLLTVLDHLIKDVDVQKIIKVVFSTTLITNLVAEEKIEPVACLLVSGPGIPLRKNLFKTALIKEVTGAIDYRGREIVPLDLKLVEEAINEIIEKGYKKIVVAGKFAQRNNVHELAISELLMKKYPNVQFELSHKISGELNFPRRIATALLTLATRNAYSKFVDDVQAALEIRSIKVPAYILKADGGTLSLCKSKLTPMDTVYSGPAASLLGVIAQVSNTEGSIVLDIGGTTTDIGIIIDNHHPLLAAKGANINGYLTQVRAFNVNAIPFGGDSHVDMKNGEVRINSFRVGPAFCMGGQGITPTDALRYLGMVDIGCREKAKEGLEQLCSDTDLKPEQLAQKILDIFLDILEKEVTNMFRQWKLEPAYRVWEMKSRTAELHTIIGVGGGSKGIIELLGKKMNCATVSPNEGDISNAIGAALAVPTPTVTLRVDTEQGYYSYFEEGTQEMLPRGFSDKEVIDLARQLLENQLQNKDKGGLKPEVVQKEVFNVIRGSHRVGRIIVVKLQTQWEIEFKLYEEDAL